MYLVYFNFFMKLLFNYKNVMKKYDCIIIDSGVAQNHPKFKSKELFGIYFQKVDGETLLGYEFSDDIGHGSAIYYIISSNVDFDIQILNIKITDSMDFNDETILFDVLNYIYDNYECGVINISMGVVSIANLQPLQEICMKLKSRGTIIVSAYDNLGAVSYPAALSSVIGVDASINCVKATDYEFVEGSMVNILGKGGVQKVPWVNPEYAFVSGASFAAAYVSAAICNFIHGKMENAYTYDDIISYLKNTAKAVYSEVPPIRYDGLKYVQPQKVLLFPLNKEIKSIIAFNSLTNFEILHVCDIRESGNPSKQLKQVIQYRDLGELGNTIVCDINKINWDSDFDTVIIGHVKDLSNLIKKDIIRDVLEKCCAHKKNIIAFDNLNEYSTYKKCLSDLNLNLFYPDITGVTVSDSKLGKLYISSKPIVCIAGTSSSQGKYTLQLFLRELFLNMGYKVGQFSSEPSGFLFGCDETYHYGYDVYNRANYENTVMLINEKINNIALKNPDIIISGVQAGVVPAAHMNLCYLTNRQLEVMTGIMPDIVILCINSYDDIDYIRRTIQCIEGFINTTVLCCAIYPFRYDGDFEAFGKKKKIADEELCYYTTKFSLALNMPVFPISKNGASEIVDIIISYFKKDVTT